MDNLLRLASPHLLRRKEQNSPVIPSNHIIVTSEFLTDAKIYNRYMIVFIEHDILRFDVTVDELGLNVTGI